MSLKIKKKIAACFNNAAKTYATAATLQQISGDLLLEKLKALQLTPAMVADIGAGTGIFAERIKNYYQCSAIVLAIDLAENMLRQIQQNKQSKVHSIMADFDQLPIKATTVDLIYSNLALQWSLSLKQTLNEWNRILRKSGYLVFTILGQNSLRELRHCRQHINENAPTNYFPEITTIIALLSMQRFSLVEISQTIEQHYFTSVMALVRNLKATGAHYATRKISYGLAGRKILHELAHHYEPYRHSNGLLPVTYEIIYVIATKM